MKKLFLSALSFVVISCQSTTAPGDLAPQLVGTWLKFESGNSDGASYYVHAVPPDPPQHYTFRHNGAFLSNIVELSSYTRYRVEESASGTTVVLYAGALDRKSRGYVAEELPHTVEFENDYATLRLYGRCFEGCHDAFSRVN